MTRRLASGVALLLYVLTLGALLLSQKVQAQAQPSTTSAAARKREPSIKQVIEMALRASRNSSPERTRELARRARLAGLMPQLKLAAERGLQQDLSASTSSTADRTNASQGDDLSLQASLTFELDRLVFAPEEVRLLSVERWLAGDRRKLIEEVVKLYFQRKRLMRERATAASPDPELDLAIGEIEALLDALTDGGFGRALAAS